jgi:outer membrane protein assembly factor BamB
VSNLTRPAGIAFLAALLLAGLGCQKPAPPNESLLNSWETFQGNSIHSGYVPTLLNPRRFRKKWEWDRPNKDAGVMPYINPVAVENGLVFVTEDDYSSAQKLYALREKEGRCLWTYDFGRVAGLNPPAVHQGRVCVITSGHEDTAFWVFDAISGGLLAKTPFDVQWPRYLAPTVSGKTAYNNSGYGGGKTLAFALGDGSILWESAAYGDNDMFTPAVDGEGIYHYSGSSLVVLSPVDGGLLLTIPDPDPDVEGYYSFIGATARGSLGNVVCFSGDNFSGEAASSTEGYFERRLISFDVKSRSVVWKSASRYLTHPAIADGQVFAAANVPLRLEALSEATGEVLWAWTPTDSSVTSFHRNIVATKNIIFVSSDIAVHAISRETHQEVWSYPEPGALAISDGRVLYIGVGARKSDGRLVAIALD